MTEASCSALYFAVLGAVTLCFLVLLLLLNALTYASMKSQGLRIRSAMHPLAKVAHAKPLADSILQEGWQDVRGRGRTCFCFCICLCRCCKLLGALSGFFLISAFSSLLSARHFSPMALATTATEILAPGSAAATHSALVCSLCSSENRKKAVGPLI